MAIYKYSEYLKRSGDGAFDKIRTPGTLAPHSDIYRCEACGFEASSAEGNPLPPARTCDQHHARWSCNPGQVRWGLAVYAEHTKD